MNHVQGNTILGPESLHIGIKGQKPRSWLLLQQKTTVSKNLKSVLCSAPSENTTPHHHCSEQLSLSAYNNLLYSAMLYCIQSTLGNSAIFTTMQWIPQMYLIAVLQIHLRTLNVDIYKVMNLEQLNNHSGQKKKEEKSQRYSVEMQYMEREKLRTEQSPS